MLKSFIILSFLFSFSFGHKLNVFTDFENSKLFISTYFANGNACKNCKIKLKKDKKVILEAKTNTKGEFETIINEKDFLVFVDAGSGHEVSQKVLEEKTINEEIKDNKVKELQDENRKLKAQVEALEKKLDQMNIFKTLLALALIVGIFAFLKRVKK